jgi:hypothetical protein
MATSNKKNMVLAKAKVVVRLLSAGRTKRYEELK